MRRNNFRYSFIELNLSNIYQQTWCLFRGLNLVLRLAWLQPVLHYNFGSIDYRITGLFLAALEVIRRGQWNFYRYNTIISKV